MRIFRNFREATNEIQRDLKEMGTKVHPRTFQNKVVATDSGYDTFELQDYIYRVTQPYGSDCDPTQPWADEEFMERNARYERINPGEAWKRRPYIWKDFLVNDDRFEYTYSERLNPEEGPGIWSQINRVIHTLSADPQTRRAYISIWDPEDLLDAPREHRIPCTLGYYFQIRNGALNITYLQRACDFVTHYQNDIYLAHLLQKTIAAELDVPVGTFTHWVGSLHVFAKDVEDVF